ncbi:MAG: beta-lactamase family protein [Chitinophaga sp.]|uniref:serine hydrolase domain-containing protein n=1 Tax=Chitinophaga sp. TaxID=1869181 RepID=UPI0025C1511B|nr:serine hydrolase domain-containing protein [Chitinophaga sp.]MBV8255138.1 beta-lactamase family protein [Chitinophaga sp.]
MKSLLLYICQLLSPVPSIDSQVHIFMQQYQVPGLAVAVSYHDKPVFAKGYGWADTAQRMPVTVNSLFRIGSVSKTITATAILKLVEQGRLRMDEKVFGAAGILGTHYGALPYSANLQQITVKQLLQHTSGGWPNNDQDPGFLYPALSQDSLISKTLDEVPLRYPPGEMYMYSNFGYNLLGRIIEKITGLSYEAYVCQQVLKPAGIQQLCITPPSDRSIVRYYGQNGQDPYSFPIQKMDAYAGWIGSATDLLKFLDAIDGDTTLPDLLSAGAIREMTSGSAPNPAYACGWVVDSFHNWWHAGSLPGTAALILHTPSGFNAVILCNTRADKAYFNDLDGLLHAIIQSLSHTTTGTKSRHPVNN